MVHELLDSAGVKMPESIPLWEIEKLRPYEKNARMHSQEQVEEIAASMLEFGFTNPILIDEQDGILAGHGRLMAANYLGLKRVPVVALTHLSEAQKRAYIIADNQLALKSSWDDGILRKEILALKEQGFDLSLTGLTDEDLLRLLPDVEQVEEQGNEEAVPELPMEPVSRLGDLWLLGKHRLMVGNSLEIGLVEKLMDGRRADMIFTDPRCNANKAGKTKDTLKIQNDKTSNDELYNFLKDAFINMFTVTKPGGAIYVAHPDSEGLNFRKALVDSGFLFKQSLIWVKQSIVLGHQDYHWQHEPILYGWQGEGSHSWHGDRKQSTVWNFDMPQNNPELPTNKPVELVERALLNSSDRSQVVLDLFGGSGTTLIACEKNSRKAHLMELDPKLADVIVKRYEEYSGKKAILETGQSFEDLSAERKKK